LELVAQGLQTRWQVPPEQAQLLAHLSGGRPGYALRLHQQPEILEQRSHWLDDHRHLISSKRLDRFAYAEEITKERDFAKTRENVRQIFETWLSLWRDIMLRAAGANTPVTNLDRQGEIEVIAAQLDLGKASRVVSQLERTLTLLDSNINTRLAAEVFMLDLPRLG
jgi:DNA polymerase-3 subunit delta'